jgi:sugar phosphate isomerase/epimerase
MYRDARATGSIEGVPMPPSTVPEPAPAPAPGRHRFDPRIVACYLYPITRYGYPPPAEGTHRYVEELAGLGFRSIELEGIHAPHLTAMHGMRGEVRRTLDRLEVSVPYYCVVLPGLASADPAVRAASLALFELGCETARALGATGVLDNGPLPPYAFPGDVPVVRHYDEDVLASAGLPRSLDWSAYWRDLVATYREACDVAARFGLTYLIHPAIGVLCANTDGFLLFRESVDRPNLRFNLDTANQFVARDHLPLSLVRLADHVDYIHVSDARGTRPEHLPLGAGAIDWDVLFATLEQIDYRGSFGIDIGGSESDVADLDRAYVDAATFVEGWLRRT